jgi:prepilin-type N-terminal cleavage/methylation domain-containing protein
LRDERGFSLLELVVVVVIVSLLALAAIDRLLKLRFEAERAGVQSVVGALKSALYIEFAAAAARGEIGRMGEAAGSNPMVRLAEKPEGYAGEFYGADAAVFEPGSWYFDTRDRALVYVVRFPEQFSSALAGTPRARFAVAPDFDDLDGNGRFDAGRDALRGLTLVAVEPFSWKGGR